MGVCRVAASEPHTKEGASAMATSRSGLHFMIGRSHEKVSDVPVVTSSIALAGSTVEVREVVMDYRMGGSHDESHHAGIGPINLTIDRSEFVSILGPSGSGKTTLLRLIAGLLVPTSGEILVDGDAVRQPSRSRAVVFQEPALYPWYNVRQNVAIALLSSGISRAVRDARADHYLELVGLADFGWMRPRQLSGGMKQRVMIARTLAMQSECVLMDEPFAALDEISREKLQEEVLRIWIESKSTVVFVTHSIPEAVFLSQRVVVLGSANAGIIHDTRVDAPYPRNYEFRGSALASHLRKELHGVLGECG